LFAAAGFYWLLPGHFQISQYTTGPIDITAVLMLSLTWLICYAGSTKVPKGPLGRLQRGFTLVFLVIVAVNYALHLCIPTQGLKGKYYANADFQPPIESSWTFKADEYTRIDPQIDFTPVGFSFIKQSFPLYFSNDWYKRSWKENSDNDTNGYLFSGEWNGRINLPEDITALAVQASAGHASLTLDGIDYPDGKVSTLSSGPQEIYVRYARQSNEPPSLSLQWLKDGQWRVVPSHAFSESVWTAIIPHLQFGIFLSWLATLGYLAWGVKAVNICSYRTFLWFVFVCIIAKSALKLAENGSNFNFQIFTPGNDWLLYETFARGILQGNWLTTQETPFITMNFAYRYILAFLHLIGGEAPADVMLLQISSMALLITVAAGTIAKRWGIVVSLVFLVIVLWSKQMMKFSEPLLDTTWGVAAGIFILYGLMQYESKASRKWLVFVGISLGIGILIRANYLPFLVVAALWVLLVGPKRSWQKKATDLAILFTLVVGLMSLIGLRNQLVAGEWRWLPASGLPNLWVGNHPPEFDGPTYFVLGRPAEHEILQYVIKYILSDPLAMLQRVFDKSLYIFGVDVREGFKVKDKVLLPWLVALFGSVFLWIRPQLLQRRELILLWAWIGFVNFPLATLFFPWGYGWRLSGPSFFALYLIGALAVFQWYGGGKALWLAKHSGK
jgi:hypothetical protein